MASVAAVVKDVDDTTIVRESKPEKRKHLEQESACLHGNGDNETNTHKELRTAAYKSTEVTTDFEGYLKAMLFLLTEDHAHNTKFRTIMLNME